MNVDAARIPHAGATVADPDPLAPRAPLAPAQSFAEGLLRITPLDGADGAEGASWAPEWRRFGLGLGLASIFGAAIGLRAGGGSIPIHALGVSAGLVAVAGIAVPAFAIILALANAPIDARSLARATTRAVAKAGLVLGGLAPAAALYVATVEDAITVSIVGFGGLLLAGMIAMSSFARDLAPSIASAPSGTRAALHVAMPAFRLFAAVLALRVWWLVLPTLSTLVSVSSLTGAR